MMEEVGGLEYLLIPLLRYLGPEDGGSHAAIISHIICYVLNIDFDMRKSQAPYQFNIYLRD